MGLISMRSNLTWQGLTTQAPGRYAPENIQNKISSFQEADIRDQYNKFHVWDSPNVNRLSFGRATDQPFIVRGIQRRNGDEQFYGPGGRTSPQNMMIRGGLVAFAARLAEDAVRMAKFMISPKGLIWNVKQAGLQASNPNVESLQTIRPTKSYNPVEFAKNFITAPEGIHKARHGGAQQQGKYGDVQKKHMQSDAEKVVSNRLARLKVELFGNGQPEALDQETPTDLLGIIAQGVNNFLAPINSAFSGFDGSEIKELSGMGGPKSVYGIGYTTIRRTVTSGNVLKEQGGPHQGKAFWGIHYSSNSKYESEETPGVPKTLNSTSDPGNSVEKTYKPKQDKGFPTRADLPNKDAETGGNSVLNITDKFSNEEIYLQSYTPKGGRFVGDEQSLENIKKKEDINRPIHVDPETAEERTILEGTPETENELFPIGEKYLASNSPALNVSKATTGAGQQVEPHSPGGGRYVGSSHDGSEETHKRATNAEGENLLEHAHHYHPYQNRDADYPEGYYNIANSSGGPRGKPIGGSKHNIYATIEAENELIRTLVDGKKITEHIHTFLGENTQGVQTREPTTAILPSIVTGYVLSQLRGTPIVGEDWDAQDRINLYQLIDPVLGDASNANTPQIRKSAERVFEPGSPVGYKPNASKLISSKDTSLPLTPTGFFSLSGVKIGQDIFNYFTPDLKFFTGNTKEQIDDGGPNDYISLKQRYETLSATANVFGFIYGYKDPIVTPSYNGTSYAPKYTPSTPFKGASPEAGQQPISDQTTRDIEIIDDEILTKLDPLQNEKARPDETGNIKTVGGKPKSSAGTPLVYNYMNYTEIRQAALNGGVLNPGRIQEFRRAVASGVANEIQERNRVALGYGGTKTADSIMKLKPGQKPDKEDLVPFMLAMQGGAEACYFRCGINSINDSFSPEWAQESEIGRADPKILLKGFGRTISLDLTMAAGSSEELVPMWSKLNRIAGWTAPVYKGNGYTGVFCELTLGDIYSGVPCYVSSFSVDMDNETPWDISPGQRAPMYCNVSIELAYVGEKIPQKGSKFFGIAPFTGQDVLNQAKNVAEQLPAAFDAVEGLLPEGTPSHLGEADYNMAKDILGDVGNGIVAGADVVTDFMLPGDQSGGNAMSKQISKIAQGDQGGARNILSNLNPFR